MSKIARSACGIGFKVLWQSDPLNAGRYGAVLIEVLLICLDELETVNRLYPCRENMKAIAFLSMTISALQERKARRESEGTYGEHAETPSTSRD